jgi:hypothetical protein
MLVSFFVFTGVILAAGLQILRSGDKKTQDVSCVLFVISHIPLLIMLRQTQQPITVARDCSFYCSA